MPENDQETFLKRWNRLKQEAKPAPVEHRLTPDSAAVETGAGAYAGPPEPLPSLDDITADGDISAFMGKHIPAELKRLALRKAWTTDPTIRDFIEMAENQYDWNTPGGAPGFGPLDPSWDLEKLLAQATGALPPARTDETDGATIAAADHNSVISTSSEEVSSDGAVQKKAIAAPQAIQSVAYGSSAALPFEIEPPGAVATSQNTACAEENALALHHGVAGARRRHGGALPT